MGQINIGLGVYSTPPVGTCGYGFSAPGKPIYIDSIGVAHELYSDVSVDGVSANILANLGVGLEADLPVASAGYTYVTNDTFKIYQGIDDGVYNISDLKQGQLVTDTYNIPRTTYQLIGLELATLVGGSSVEICDQTDVELAEPTENTKATSALRAWQGFVYWCKNTMFPELNTTDKTIVGAVNETYELAKNGSAVGGYANNLYFDETDSDVVGYETLSYTPPALETTEVWTVNDGEGVKLFQSYLYPSAVSVNFIPAGQWSFQFWGNVSSAAGVTKLGATYFKRSALGVETDLLTVWSSEIDNTTPDWIKFSLTFPNFTVDPTDRMGCRVLGQTTHNSDITITYVVGDGYGAWINNPNRIRHTQLRDFNGDSAVQHIDNSTVKTTPIDADKLALWDSVAGKMVTLTIASIKTFLALIFRLITERGDAHGFINPPNAGNFTLSNTGASITINLLANAGNYKINGTEYVNAGLSRTFTASLGQNFLCIDNTGLIVSPIDIMSRTKIPCATVTWDGTNVIIGDELHTTDRNLIQHKKEHDTDGARYVNGFDTTFGAGAANTFSSATGIVRDEERYHTIGARTQAMICYRNVSGTAMLYDAPSTNYAKVIGGLPQYDNAGVQTALGANNYGIMWMYVTNNKLPVNSEIVFVQGQAAYANIGAAQVAPIPTLNGMTIAEWKLAYRVIIRQVANALVFIQADDYRIVAGGLAVNGGGLTSINAANVICTAPTGFTATDQQSLDNDLAANTIKGAVATHATIVAADTIGVWDSVGNVFKKATALAFKTYVKLGLIASEVGVTTSPGYPATDQQSYNTNNASRVVKLETDETPAAIADTDNVRFKSGTGYYVRTLLAIKNYVKLGLKASEVANDSTNVRGANLKVVLDNATLATDGVTLGDNDLFAAAKVVSVLGVPTSVNVFHPWSRIRDGIINPHVYQYNVTTWEEIQAVVGDPLCRESIVFNIMQPVNGGILQTYAKNIYFRGAKIIMQSDANLWISGYVAGTYSIYLDCLIDTGSAGMPAYITLGDTQVVSTINLKVKQIQGLSTSTIVTVELNKIGASNTTTITYNELVNVQLINTSITATQEDTFYATNIINALVNRDEVHIVSTYSEFISALAINTATSSQPIPNKSIVIFCTDGFNIPNGDTIWLNQQRTLIIGADIVVGNDVKFRSVSTGQLYLEIQSEFRVVTNGTITFGDALDNFNIIVRLDFVKGSDIYQTLDIISSIPDTYIITKRARNIVLKKHPLSTGFVNIVTIDSDFYNEIGEDDGDKIIHTIDRNGVSVTEITYVYDGVNGVKVFDITPYVNHGIRIFEVYDRQIYCQNGYTDVYGINLTFSSLYTNNPVTTEELNVNPNSLLGYFRLGISGNEGGYYANHWDISTLTPTLTVTKTGVNTDRIIRRMTLKGMAENIITQI